MGKKNNKKVKQQK